MDATRLDADDGASQGAPKKPWLAPQVILSNPMSSAGVSNKGQNITPDNRALNLTPTSTS